VQFLWYDTPEWQNKPLVEQNRVLDKVRSQRRLQNPLLGQGFYRISWLVWTLTHLVIGLMAVEAGAIYHVLLLLLIDKRLVGVLVLGC
jgi:hypothetical protein